MKSVSSLFTNASMNSVRKPFTQVKISWDKALSDAYNYFTLNVSQLDGGDILQGDGNPINENSVFNFADESQYVISVEVDKYADGPVFSVARSIASIVLDNNSGRFTPNGTSDIAAYIKPNRIIKINVGFEINDGYEVVQTFIGQLTEYPRVDSKAKTVTLIAQDFASIFWEQNVKSTEMFVDSRADEIINQLLTDFGIDDSKLDLGTGTNVIAFAYFDKNDKIGQVISKLCEAEMARFYQDDDGILRFQSRDAWNRSPYDTSVLTLDDSDIIDESSPNADTVLNSIEITGKPREVQDNQFLYELDSVREIQPGLEVEFFINFEDPIYTVETPTKDGAKSYYKAGFTLDGNDESASEYIQLTGWEVFSKAIKVTLSNQHETAVIYNTKLNLWGEPVRIIGGKEGVQVKATDADSIEEFGVKALVVNNDFIQSNDYAQSYAQVILADRKDISDYLVVTIPGLPQLEIGDRITRNSIEYNLVRNRIAISAMDGFTQQLTLAKKTIYTYFRIGISTIGGADIIAP